MVGIGEELALQYLLSLYYVPSLQPPSYLLAQELVSQFLHHPFFPFHIDL